MSEAGVLPTPHMYPQSGPAPSALSPTACPPSARHPLARPGPSLWEPPECPVCTWAALVHCHEERHWEHTAGLGCS